MSYNPNQPRNSKGAPMAGAWASDNHRGAATSVLSGKQERLSRRATREAELANLLDSIAGLSSKLSNSSRVQMILNEHGAITLPAISEADDVKAHNAIVASGIGAHSARFAHCDWMERSRAGWWIDVNRGNEAKQAAIRARDRAADLSAEAQLDPEERSQRWSATGQWALSESEFDEELHNYLDAELWAAGDMVTEDGEAGQAWADEYDHTDFARESVDKAEITLAAVINAAPSSALLHRESSLSLGHDLALTRGRHGAGFWDRGTGHDGDRLTDAAHGAGETNLEVGDDGQVHLR